MKFRSREQPYTCHPSAVSITGYEVGFKNIARDDHVGVAEVHHAVGAAVRIRLIQHFDAFAVEELAEFVLRRHGMYRGKRW